MYTSRMFQGRRSFFLRTGVPGISGVKTLPAKPWNLEEIRSNRNRANFRLARTWGV